MDPRSPPEYTLELSADRASVKDVVKGRCSYCSLSPFRSSCTTSPFSYHLSPSGIIHTIFFHRYLTPLHPAAHDVLDLTLPYITEDDFEALVEQRCNALLRQLEGGGSVSSAYGSLQTSPTFYPSAYNPTTTSSSPARAQVLIHFLEKKRRKSGWFVSAKADEEMLWESWTVDVTLFSTPRSEPEAARNRRQMERSLQKAMLTVVTVAGRDRSHIPPITSNDEPFPYRVTIVSPPNSRR